MSDEVKVPSITSEQIEAIADKKAAEKMAALQAKLQAEYQEKLEAERVAREKLLADQEALKEQMKAFTSALERTVKLPEPPTPELSPTDLLQQQLEKQKAEMEALKAELEKTRNSPGLDSHFDAFRKELAEKELREYIEKSSKKLQFPDRLTGNSREEVDKNLERLLGEEKAYQDKLEQELRKKLPVAGPLESGKIKQEYKESFTKQANAIRKMTMKEMQDLQRKKLEERFNKR